MALAARRIFLLTTLAAAIAMPGIARADATQPAVMRPEMAQFRVDAGDCGVIPVRIQSDEALFGSSSADGVR